MRVGLHLLPDALAPSHGRIDRVLELRGSWTVAQVVARHAPAEFGTDLIVVWNGAVLGEPERQTVPLCDGDDLAVARRPLGDFGVTLLISLLVSAAGAVVSHLMAPSLPGLQRDDSTSPTYSFGGIEATTGVGGVVMVNYGRHRVAGQIIQSIRSAWRLDDGTKPPTIGADTLSLLISLGEGPVHTIGGRGGDTREFNDLPPFDAVTEPTGIKDIEINGNPLTPLLYPNARFWGRTGYLQQRPIEGFGDIRIEYPVGEGFALPFTPQQLVVREESANVPGNFLSLLGVHTKNAAGAESAEGFSPDDRVVVNDGGPRQEERIVRSVSHFLDTFTTLTSYSGDIINIPSNPGFQVGDIIRIGAGATRETHIVRTVTAPTQLRLSNPVFFTHAVPGIETVARRAGLVVTNPFSELHQVGEIVRRNVIGPKKVVVYRTTALASRLSTEPSDPGIIIHLRHESLFRQDPSSGIGGKLVEFDVSDRPEGSPNWSAPVRRRLTDRRTSSFRTQIGYVPANRGDALLDIRIERVTPLDGDQERSVTVVEAVTEVEPDQFAYPGHVLLACKIIATDQLNNRDLQVTAVVEGRTCRTVTAGVISTAETYTRNNAWIALDALTHPRYGMGDTFPLSRLDLPAFEKWAAYCDQLVSDGEGGTHERFQFDGPFDQNEPRFEAAQRIASQARCVLVDIGGVITPRYEHDDDPGGGQARPRSQTLNMANVKRGSFSIRRLNRSSKPTSISVEFRNEAKNWEPDFATEESRSARGLNAPGALNRVDYRPETLREFGTTREAQARRSAVFRDNVNHMPSWETTFQVPPEALEAMVKDRVGLVHGRPKWFGAGPLKTNVSADSASAQNVLSVRSVAGIMVGDAVDIGPGTAREERGFVASIDPDALTLTLDDPLTFDHDLAGADIVAVLGNGTHTTVSALSSIGTALLTVADTSGFSDGDEVWIAPGVSGRDERAFIHEVKSATELLLRTKLVATHTAGQADTVVNLTYPSFSARTTRDFATATTTELFLDREVTIAPSFSHYIALVRERDGTITEVTITAAPGVYAKDTAISFAGPALNIHRSSPVSIGIDHRTAKDAVITSITLTPDLFRAVTCIEWVPEIFDDQSVIGALDATTTVDPPQIPDLPSIIPPASSVTDPAAEQVINVATDGTAGEGVAVAFDRTPTQRSGPVRVYYRRQSDPPEPWRFAGVATDPPFRITEANEPGVTYEVSVVPTSADGTYPDPSVQTPAVVTVFERGSRFPGRVGRVKAAVR